MTALPEIQVCGLKGTELINHLLWTGLKMVQIKVSRDRIFALPELMLCSFFFFCPNYSWNKFFAPVMNHFPLEESLIFHLI